MDPAVAAEMQGLSYQRDMKEAMARGDSDIQRFYSGTTLFITGGSGFIGKHLIEKLFRSCEIRKVYVLIRPKRGKTASERIQEMLSDTVFDTVHQMKPDLEQRIVAVEGDVAEVRLGISEHDWRILIDEVDIIFHEAATIRFDEAIRQATLINVRGTRETLKLGKACKKLKSFIHVSTAYCHTTSSRVGGDLMEQFYECPASPDTMILLANADDDQLDKYIASRIKGWPNTYTFTKAIAEELVRTERGDMRVTIVRPSIVLCSYIEPTPGWLDMCCMYGPSGIVMGVGIGIIRVFYVDNKSKLSFIPVDYVNNATIAAGWLTAVKQNNDIEILHISSTSSGVTFRHISEPMRNQCWTIASPMTIWYPYLFETNNRAVYWFLSWILHYIPAYTVDTIIKVFGLKKPKQMKSFIHVYDKYDKMQRLFQYFLTKGWNFDDTKLNDLWNRMSNTDRQIYNFDMKTIDWNWYTMMWCLGVRKFILKDGLKNTKKAVEKLKWFKLANFSVGLLYLLIFWFLLRFVYNIFF